MNYNQLILDRIKSVPPSGIRKYFTLINEMKDAISLGIGEPDFVTPWSIVEAGIYSLEKGHTHYSPNAGYKDLLKVASSYMKRRFSLKYDYNEEILMTVGGSEAIDLCLRCLVKEGDEVIVPEPSFVAYNGCVRFTGATPIPIPLNEVNSFKLLPEDLEKAITDKTKVIIIPFPNNPTGSTMNRQELKDIAQVIKDKEIIVISDELYAELTYEGNHVSIANIEGMYNKTVVINGFSKAFAMTGWRIGFACGNKVIIDAMKKIHQYAIMCAPTMAQNAALEALNSGQNDVDRMVREYNRRRRILVDGMRKAGLSCFEPTGAFYVFPSIKNTGLTSDAFCERLLNEEQVLTIPGNAFGECGEGFIRATYANSTENIKEAVKRIIRFTKTL